MAETGERIEHAQMDAILMSLSAIALMAHIRYSCWRISTELAGRTPCDKVFTNSSRGDSETLKRLCQLLDDAMQFIGDVNSSTDAVDEYGLTDAAFAQMDRALGRETIATGSS